MRTPNTIFFLIASLILSINSLHAQVSGGALSTETVQADSLLAPIENDIDSVTSELKDTLHSLQEAQEERVDQINSQLAKGQAAIDKAGLQEEIPALPTLEPLPIDNHGLDKLTTGIGTGTTPPKLPDMGSLKIEDKLSQVDIPSLPNEEIGKASELTEQVSDIKNGADSLSVEKAAEYGEKYVKESKYYEALEDQANQSMEIATSAEDMIDQGKKVPVAQARNYFAGHEDKIREANALLGKYKKKYHSLPSTKDVPLNRNPLADTPLIKRMVFGSYVQLQKKPWGGDINAVIGYKLYPKWEAGAGFVYRALFSIPEDYKYAEDPKVYGLRAYSSFQVSDIFTVHAEYDLINTLIVYPNLGGEVPASHRDWVSGLNVGIRKKIELNSHLQMRGVMLYNLLHDYQSPYGSSFHIRLGFFYVP